LGQALVTQFADEGATVLAWDRPDATHPQQTLDDIAPGEWRHFGDKRDEYDRWVLDRQCLKRRIQPADVANPVLFLSSPQADLITGQDIHCDGGW
jgi:NAD(P)-dependent dehydrogenase (short-subunit alcohol dehydrogenase family)